MDTDKLSANQQLRAISTLLAIQHLKSPEGVTPTARVIIVAKSLQRYIELGE